MAQVPKLLTHIMLLLPGSHPLPQIPMELQIAMVWLKTAASKPEAAQKHSHYLQCEIWQYQTLSTGNSTAKEATVLGITLQLTRRAVVKFQTQRNVPWLEANYTLPKLCLIKTVYDN